MNECKNFSFIDYCPQVKTLPSHSVIPTLDPDFAFPNNNLIGIYVFVITYLVMIAVIIGLKYGTLQF